MGAKSLSFLFFLVGKRLYGGDFRAKKCKKEKKTVFWWKNKAKSLECDEKAVSLQRQKQNGWFCWKIGLWCNGNTTDSGPVFPGSSPGSPTGLKWNRGREIFHDFFCIYVFLNFLLFSSRLVKDKNEAWGCVKMIVILHCDTPPCFV